MTELKTCCELINQAQQALAEISYNTPSAPEGASSLYLCAANSGLKVAQRGLLELSKKTCEVKCCEVASEAIVEITQDYFDLLNQINNATNDLKIRKQNYQFLSQSIM